MVQENLRQQLTFRFRHHGAYLAICLAGITAFLVAVALLAYFVDADLSQLERWVKSLGGWGPIIFILGAAVLCVLFCSSGNVVCRGRYSVWLGAWPVIRLFVRMSLRDLEFLHRTTLPPSESDPVDGKTSSPGYVRSRSGR